MFKLTKAVALALAAGVTITLAGCGNGASGPDAGKTTINFWAGFQGADGDTMKSIVDQFEADHPEIDVTFYTAPWNEMFTKFGTSHGTPSGPDVVIMHATDIANFASRKMLTPLDDVATELGIDKANYADPIWAGNTFDGTQWGIPLDYHPMGVYKNVELFKAAGIDPEVEFTSREQFLSVAKQLTSGEQYGIGMGSDYAHTMRYWYGLLYQAGGEFLNQDNTAAAFNQQPGVDALQFLSDLVNVDGVAPKLQADIDRDFLAGTTAMVIEGPWFIPTMEESGMEYTVAPFPTIFGEPGTWAGSHTITIPSGGSDEGRKAAAQTLVKYLAENSIPWAKSGQIPASKVVLDSAEFKALPTYDKARAFIAQADHVHFEPLIQETAELGADNPLSPVLTGVLEGVRADDTAQAALDRAAEATDQILSK